jgi:hypothetical protein
MWTIALIAKPCGAFVVTVIILLDSEILEIAAVTCPRLAAPDVVLAVVEAAEHPPN